MCRQCQGCSVCTQDPSISHLVSRCWTKAHFHSFKALMTFTLPQEASQEEDSDGIFPDGIFIQAKKSAESWQLAVSWQPAGVRDVGKARSPKDLKSIF